jgi:hypothetical protein
MITEDIASKINSVSEEIWSSMVNIPLTQAEASADSLVMGERVSSSVHIVGRWEGAVCLDMGIDLAHRATASLVGADLTEISHDDTAVQISRDRVFGIAKSEAFSGSRDGLRVEVGVSAVQVA